jgi:C4-dicarboxylate-specific signal transduction histidine kinase
MLEKEDIHRHLLDDDKMNALIDHSLWSKQFIKKNIRVLVVDDVETNILYMNQLIEINGGTSFVSKNGKEAVAIFEKQYVDVVVMDLYMPVMNGFEATFKIKELAGDYFVPIIICSAYASDKVIAKAQACGADDIMTRPFSLEVFFSKINTMLRLKEFYDKEKAFAQHLQKEILERKKANARLIEFQKQLEEKVKTKTAQLRQKDLELIEMDRITSINTLAAGMAHKINNPLGFVKSSVDSLKQLIHSFIDKKECQNQLSMDRIERLFVRIEKGIKRISQLIDTLRYLSNVNKSEMIPVNINKSIEKTIDLFQTSDTKGPKFSTIFADLPNILCSGTEIHLCLMNVIKNARDALLEHDNPEICITSQYNEINDQIVICVKDNGAGMPPETLRRVFNPFYTTRPVGQGTGLGLTLTERILKRYGGNIYLDSQQGKGTTVTIVLSVSV